MKLSGSFRRTRSFPHCALLRARRSRANPQALLPLSLPDARWRTDRARRTSGGFAPLQGCRCLCGSLARSLRGNAKGFALSFPKPQTDAPGWRALPAGPHQGIGLRFSLPLPSSPEGRRHGRAMLARDKSSAGDGDATHRRRNSAMVFYQEHPDPELARNAPCLCAGCGITAMDFN